MNETTVSNEFAVLDIAVILSPEAKTILAPPSISSSEPPTLIGADLIRK
jgi:hypothetical protein